MLRVGGARKYLFVVAVEPYRWATCFANVQDWAIHDVDYSCENCPALLPLRLLRPWRSYPRRTGSDESAVRTCSSPWSPCLEQMEVSMLDSSASVCAARGCQRFDSSFALIYFVIQEVRSCRHSRSSIHLNTDVIRTTFERCATPSMPKPHEVHSKVRSSMSMD